MDTDNQTLLDYVLLDLAHLDRENTGRHEAADLRYLLLRVLCDNLGSDLRLTHRAGLERVRNAADRAIKALEQCKHPRARQVAKQLHEARCHEDRGSSSTSLLSRDSREIRACLDALRQDYAQLRGFLGNGRLVARTSWRMGESRQLLVSTEHGISLPTLDSLLVWLRAGSERPAPRERETDEPLSAILPHVVRRAADIRCADPTDVANWRFVTVEHRFGRRLPPAEVLRWLPELRSVQRLEIVGIDGGDAIIDVLLRESVLEHVDCLVLEKCGVTSAGASALTASSQASRLARLSLRGNPIGWRGLAAALSSPALRSLIELDVSECAAGEEPEHVPIDGANRAGLRALDISRNGLSAAAAQEISSLLRHPTLVQLRASGNPLGDVGVACLVQRSLETVDVSACGAAEGAVEALVTGATRLREVVASYNCIGAGSIATFAGHAPHVRVLDLRHNPLGESAGRELGAARWPALEDVSLDATGLTDYFTPDWVACSPSLRGATLGRNRVSDKWASAFAALPRLTWLDLECNRVRDDGAVALCGSTSLRSAGVLDVRWNRIGERGRRAMEVADNGMWKFQEQGRKLDVVTGYLVDRIALGDGVSAPIATVSSGDHDTE